MYAEIAFPISGFQTFIYKVPENLKTKIAIGSRVKAPFKTKVNYGIVVSIKSKPNYQGKIRSIKHIDELSFITKELWSLAKWISDYYHSPIGKVVKSIIPFNISSNYKPKPILIVNLKGSINKEDLTTLNKRSSRQFEILNVLLSKRKPIFISKLKKKYPQALSICRALEKKDLVKITIKDSELGFDDYIFDPIYKKITFNNDQKKACSQIKESLDSKAFSPFLLHGVTGSGKTEIYINSIKHCISKKRTAIVLLPEISLTPQIAGRFRSVFGNIIALWHSKLSRKEKWLTWNKICKNEYKIVIGARSAVFLPLKNLGLIVVDEEQESSFRQNNPSPRYNARDVSLVRGKNINAVVLLSSATPSLETYYNYLNKKIQYISLPKRFGNAKYPKVHLVDMVSEQNETGKIGINISGLLQNKIEDRLNKKEQVILLQNRRGHSPILRCFNCGDTVGCPFCKMALSYHKNILKLICHSCGYANKIIEECISCNSKSIKYLGTGTQKIESIIKETFPKANFARLDTDSIQNSNDLTNILKKFAKGYYDILIGTQIIAKGLDFPNATLVGVINADIGLNIPDFRSGEKIFQLLYQASGRAGRREKPGEVVIQTFSPEDPSIKFSALLNMKKYYDLILKDREELNYPPYSWITKIEVSGLKKSYVLYITKKFKQNLSGFFKGLNILGPAPCYYEKIRNKYRFQFILKSSKKFDPNSKKLHKFVKKNFINYNFKISFNKCKVSIHKDPINLV